MPETVAERPPHRTVPVQVWVDVDDGIADFVRFLNTLPGVRTHASCQGGLTYGPQVMVTWENDAALAALRAFPMTMISETLAYVHPQQAAVE